MMYSWTLLTAGKVYVQEVQSHYSIDFVAECSKLT